MILKSNNLRTFQLPNEQRLLSLRQHREAIVINKTLEIHPC